MPYVDGFVAAVPSANRKAFAEHATHFAKIFKQHGALRIVECWGDDVPDGQVTSFPMAVKREADEDVVFSWIEWPDKETRDRFHDAMRSDPEMAGADMEMPFDGKRVIFGGFTPILDE